MSYNIVYHTNKQQLTNTNRASISARSPWTRPGASSNLTAVSYNNTLQPMYPQ